MQGMFECQNCLRLVWHDIFGETLHECELCLDENCETRKSFPYAKHYHQEDGKSVLIAQAV